MQTTPRHMRSTRGIYGAQRDIKMLFYTCDSTCTSEEISMASHKTPGYQSHHQPPFNIKQKEMTLSS